VKEIKPDPEKEKIYDGLYRIFKDAYAGLKPVCKSLAGMPR
jgi:hypothetical protein